MSYDPEKITYFGETDARGRRVKFGIKAKDRDRHIYVVGKTGMGKSTMLENMAIQDIQNGEGLAFIDPHGSTAEKLLDYVPEDRIKDVLYFAPFDMEYPVSFNVMEDVGYDKRHLVVSGLMSTFKKIWVDAWSARMEYILSNTLLALLEYPGSTLLGVNRMLSDKVYRDLVVANVKDPSVKSFWVDEFAKYTERMAAEAVPAIQNKIGQFTANPLIRNIIGQEKSSFDVRQFMDEKKIFIVNLSKGLIGETNANLLGAMLITRIYLSAMSRADMPAAELAKAPKFYFYVDEFQSFANETFASILSEARKYKLSLTIAHQYIAQMEDEVRDAVFGNVGTTITFRVGPFDAEVLETVFSPEFLATDIVNLGYTQIYLTLMIDGIGSRPFSATTLPPIQAGHVSYKDMVIAESHARFGQSRATVEEQIRVWHEPVKKPVVEKPHIGPVPDKILPKQEVPQSTPRPTAPKQESVKHSAPRPANHTPPRAPDVRPREQESAVPVAKVEKPAVTIVRDTHQRPAPQAANVEDFKAVLKSIVSPTEKKVPVATPQPTRMPPRQSVPVRPPRSERPEPKPDPKSALRSALADVLKNPPIKPVEKKPEQPRTHTDTHVPKPAPNVDAAPLLPQTPSPQPVHAETPSQSPAPTEQPVRVEPMPQPSVPPTIPTPTTHVPSHVDDEKKTLRELERILRSKGNERPPLG